MTLATKFTGLESQLTTQQTAVIDALNAILTALGAPPETAVATLADTNLILTDINNNLIGMRGENVDFYAALLDSVGLINANTDTIITNNSLNAQKLIAALYATFCDCVTDTPLLPLPLDVTPTEVVDEAKCRRIQFYLSVFGNWLDKIANYGASGAAITGGTLATLLSVAAADAGIIATGAEVGAVAGPPGIVIGAVVGLITIAVYTLGGSVLIDYANQFNDATLRDNMVLAMYDATNADEGYTAFKSTLLASMDAIPAEIIYTLWWSAWSNDVYSGIPEVDDSAFDGSICAPEPSCYTFNSSTVESDYGTATAVVDTSPLPSENQGHYAAGKIFTGDFYGWTITPHDANMYLLTSASGNVLLTAPITITDHTTWIFPNGVAAFEFEICHP
jgi:hypothetical protein